MTSEPIDGVFVWTWLPGAVRPVVAGRVERVGERHVFGYGRSYLDRDDAVPLHLPELPLVPGAQAPRGALTMAGVLRDALPDAWGRQVVIARRANAAGGVMGGATGGTSAGESVRPTTDTDPDELVFMLESASNRIGALDFQRSATRYLARETDGATLDALLDAAHRIERGLPLAPELDAAILHGSSIGGARPKALLIDGERQYIAKFASSGDIRPVVRSEYVAMRLAAEVGLDVAPVRFERVAGRDVLLVERFDRVRVADGWSRRAMVSALTLFELDEMMARYASYETLANIVRRRFESPERTLHELFSRLVFNVLVGNTDDHARNHATFRSGSTLALTPAYDICPQPRTGGEATQAMRVKGTSSFSRIELCLDVAPRFRLSRDEAIGVVRSQIDVIEGVWDRVCDECALGDVERRAMRGRQILNPYAFVGTEGTFGRPTIGPP